MLVYSGTASENGQEKNQNNGEDDNDDVE